MHTKVLLKPKKESSILRGHAWIFSGAVQTPLEDIGTLVDVYSNKNKYLGTGHWSNGSIAIRLITNTLQAIDVDFWKTRLQTAAAIRQSLQLGNDTNCYRLVHGEGDGLPGLIIDVYADTAVLQAHTLGMYQHLEDIAKALISLPLGLKNIYSKSKRTVTESDLAKDGILVGDTIEEVWCKEHGLAFKIDLLHGQKTGFFLDQRDNRAFLAPYMQGKKVLNTFSYTGGFSLYALRAGASLVHSVDVSARAISVLEENILQNFEKAPHQSFTSEVQAFLKEPPTEYDIIIVDPPAFAKRLNKRHQAVIGYKKLNTQVFKTAKPGSLVATFSCSQAVDETLFTNTIAAAAIESRRSIKLLKRLGQGPDHPVNLVHPESHYLKGLLLYVD